MNVHDKIIFNHQKVELTQMSTRKWTDKLNVAYAGWIGIWQWKEMNYWYHGRLAKMLCWVKEERLKIQYILNDSVYIRYKLIYDDTKQKSDYLGPKLGGGINCKGTWGNFWGQWEWSDGFTGVQNWQESPNCTLQMNKIIACKLFLN